MIVGAGDFCQIAGAHFLATNDQRNFYLFGCQVSQSLLDLSALRGTRSITQYRLILGIRNGQYGIVQKVHDSPLMGWGETKQTFFKSYQVPIAKKVPNSVLADKTILIYLPRY